MKWWFGLASNVRIDFREICELCDGNIDYLGNKTKIEIGVGKVFITPILNTRINTPQIKFPSKWFDKTFFSDDVYALSQRSKEMNDHLLYLAKIIPKELSTHGKLNADVSHSQNASLVSVFSERAKLLLQYLHHTSIFL